MRGVDFRIFYVLEAIHPKGESHKNENICKKGMASTLNKSTQSGESTSNDSAACRYFIIALQIKEHLASLSTFGDLVCWLRQVCDYSLYSLFTLFFSLS